MIVIGINENYLAVAVTHSFTCFMASAIVNDCALPTIEFLESSLSFTIDGKSFIELWSVNYNV